MKICVIGAGAMGGTYGGRLANAGYEVHFVDAWSDHVAAINKNGLRLDGVPGDLVLKTPAFLPDGDLPTGCDLALVSVDSNNTARAAETAGRVLATEGFALPIQNGIGNVEILMERLGAGRVAAGSTMCSAIPVGPGHINQPHEGKTTIGEWDGSSSNRLQDLKAALEKAGFAVEITSGIESVVWTKFTLNVAINALCAVTGLRLGEIARLEAMDELQDRVIDEVLAVVAAKGITLQDPDIRKTIKSHCWS
jgi:2-dehydropantoate 2-reductase